MKLKKKPQDYRKIKLWIKSYALLSFNMCNNLVCPFKYNCRNKRI